MSNIFKCAQGAASARAEICHFWHLNSSPITLKLITYNFFFNDPKRTTTSQDIGYQNVFNKKKN